MLIKSLLQNRRTAAATIGTEAKVAEAAALLAAHHIDVVVVCDAAQRVLGVVTNSDILRDVASCTGTRYVCNTPISKIMTREVTTCSATDDLREVRAKMVSQGLRRIPAVDAKGRLIGVISLREVLLHQYEAAELEEEELEHYYFGIGYQ